MTARNGSVFVEWVIWIAILSTLAAVILWM